MSSYNFYIPYQHGCNPSQDYTTPNTNVENVHVHRLAQFVVCLFELVVDRDACREGDNRTRLKREKIAELQGRVDEEIE